MVPVIPFSNESTGDRETPFETLKNLETHTYSGVYPIDSNGLWHCAMHIEQKHSGGNSCCFLKPILPENGKIIAYRLINDYRSIPLVHGNEVKSEPNLLGKLQLARKTMPEVYRVFGHIQDHPSIVMGRILDMKEYNDGQKDALSKILYAHSNSFILMKYVLSIPGKGAVPFFVLYYNLAPVTDLIQEKHEQYRCFFREWIINTSALEKKTVYKIQLYTGNDTSKKSSRYICREGRYPVSQNSESVLGTKWHELSPGTYIHADSIVPPADLEGLHYLLRKPGAPRNTIPGDVILYYDSDCTMPMLTIKKYENTVIKKDRDTVKEFIRTAVIDKPITIEFRNDGDDYTYSDYVKKGGWIFFEDNGSVEWIQSKTSSTEYTVKFKNGNADDINRHLPIYGLGSSERITIKMDKPYTVKNIQGQSGKYLLEYESSVYLAASLPAAPLVIHRNELYDIKVNHTVRVKQGKAEMDIQLAAGKQCILSEPGSEDYAKKLVYNGVEYLVKQNHLISLRADIRRQSTTYTVKNECTINAQLLKPQKHSDADLLLFHGDVFRKSTAYRTDELHPFALLQIERIKTGGHLPAGNKHGCLRKYHPKHIFSWCSLMKFRFADTAGTNAHHIKKEGFHLYSNNTANADREAFFMDDLPGKNFLLQEYTRNAHPLKYVSIDERFGYIKTIPGKEYYSGRNKPGVRFNEIVTDTANTGFTNNDYLGGQCLYGEKAVHIELFLESLENFKTARNGKIDDTDLSNEYYFIRKKKAAPHINIYAGPPATQLPEITPGDTCLLRVNKTLRSNLCEFEFLRVESIDITVTIDEAALDGQNSRGRMIQGNKKYNVTVNKTETGGYTLKPGTTVIINDRHCLLGGETYAADVKETREKESVFTLEAYAMTLRQKYFAVKEDFDSRGYPEYADITSNSHAFYQ